MSPTSSKPDTQKTTAADWHPLEMLLRHAPLGIAVFDRDMHYLAANEQWARDYGGGRANLIGLNHYEVLPSLPEEWKAAHRIGLSGKSYSNDNALWVRPDGSKHWRRFVVEPWFDDKGEVGGIVVLAENITTRKLYEQELRKQGFILENIGQGVNYTDVNGSILYTNKTFDTVFGYSRGELIGHHISDIYDSDVVHGKMDVLLAEMANSIRLHGVWGGEIRARRKDGSTFDTYTTIKHLVTEDGEVWVSICEDISERKRRAKEIQERRKEQEALLQEQVAAQTASAIAHELNQPLLAISSYSEAALRMLQSDQPDMKTITRAIEASIRQAQRAGDATRELLEIMNRTVVPYESIDLGQEVRNSLATIRPDYELALRFRLEAADDVPPVYARRIHVQKVIINLMRNAIEAMKGAAVPNPELNVEIRPESNGELMRVSVRDNGPGLTPADLDRIFKPFYTTKTHGMGMGLSICRSLVEANGGRFWADAGRQGAAFHFTLPVAR
jgi:PAS domain S-box-containing protein